MSQNPYSQMQAAESAYTDTTPPRRKLSILAIIAFVLSLTCLLGPLALLLGGISIILISTSNGRKRGMPFAVIAVILGIFGSLLDVVVIAGAVMHSNQVSIAGDVMPEIEDGDLDQTKQYFTATAATAITENSLAQFKNQYTQLVGSFLSAPQGVQESFMAKLEHGQAIQSSGLQTKPFEDTSNGIHYIPADFANGLAFIIIDLNIEAGSKELEALGVSDLDGNTVWLVEK